MRFTVILLVATSVLACGGSSKPAPASTPAGGQPTSVRPATQGSVPSAAARSATAPSPSPAAGFAISSPAFPPGGSIPARFTCDGEGISPPLAWSGAPAGTAAFALVVDDPDAPGGTFTHWLIWNLPAALTALPEAVPAADQPPTGGVQGRNGGGKNGYSGACPPAGSTHHYRFTIYALKAPLSLAAGSSAAQLAQALNGQSLGQAQLIGTYQRAGR